ncbi:hypothetical protein Mapa_014630 [Marchantia paleacea]|nr:hypothetical protein Mapa_014630 [Marchantia paleacea]
MMTNVRLAETLLSLQQVLYIECIAPNTTTFPSEANFGFRQAFIVDVGGREVNFVTWKLSATGSAAPACMHRLSAVAKLIVALVED